MWRVGENMPIKHKQNKFPRNDVRRELSLLAEHMFPPKISRRDALTLFSGFDKNANRKIIGAVLQIFK